MDESILNTIKRMLGIDSSCDAFDTDIIVFINAALNQLSQCNVGDTDFCISDASSVWRDYLNNRLNLQASITYVYLYTRLLFDPPSNSFVSESMKNQMEEILWRLIVQTEVLNDV